MKAATVEANPLIGLFSPGTPNTAKMGSDLIMIPRISDRVLKLQKLYNFGHSQNMCPNEAGDIPQYIYIRITFLESLTFERWR